jgi:hypothetical protein
LFSANSRAGKQNPSQSAYFFAFSPDLDQPENVLGPDFQEI